jgi:hypothetical protein
MIATPQTPWHRLAPQHRPLLLIALMLISVSGFVTGLALHPLMLPWGQHSAAGIPTTTSTAPPQATTAPVNPVTTPAFFSAIMCAPAAAPPGGTLALSAYATAGSLGSHPPCRIGATMKPASGVSISISFVTTSGIPTPAAQTTGADGTAVWTVPVPSTTHPGSYEVKLHATWGKFSADWFVFATVRS